MQAVDERTTLTTLGRARLSFADGAEIDRFVETLGRFERGEISADAWRGFRLIHGMYGQRQDGVQMLRARLPQGIATAPQLRALADVAERYSRGFAHVTTRQNVQLHFVLPADVEAVMRRLADDGITTREACGNAVRNVTACPYAGIAEDERFDVTPYAEALSAHFLRHPLSSTLPRKLKISFEGCPVDHSLTAINDLGFRAAVRDGVRGFRVVVGGGTGTVPTAARELVGFLPAGEILRVAEGLLRVFHRLGDREHRNRNRMKFLIREMGFEAWRDEVRREIASSTASLPFDPEHPPEEGAPSWERPAPPSPDAAASASFAELRGPGVLPSFPTRAPGLDRSLRVPSAPARDLGSPSARASRFVATNVRPQRQPGYARVTVTLPLGDVTAPQLRLLADLSLAYGDGTARLTNTQDLLLRWIRSADVPELYRRLAAAGLGRDGAETITDFTSCPGAETCRLAVTHSRDLGRLVRERLEESPDLAALAPDLKLKASGCPNGCGQHHVAGIGFQGSVRKVAGRAVPQYFVMTGGETTDDGIHFAKTVSRVPARRIPEAIERLLRLYATERIDGESAPTFFRRVGPERQKALLLDLETLTPDDAREEDFVDLGQDADEAFAVEAGPGVCAR